MKDPKDPAEKIETVKPETANPVPGKVELLDPKKTKKGPRCESVIHDRPRVDIAAYHREGEEPQPAQPAFDLGKKPAEFFHERGACPCETEGRPVTAGERAKQIVRIARGEKQAFIRPPAPADTLERKTVKPGDAPAAPAAPKK